MYFKGIVRRIRRKSIFIILSLLFYLFFSIIFPLNNSYRKSNYYEYILSTLNFQSRLSYLLAPAQIFDISLLKSNNAITTIVNSIYGRISNPEILNSNWRFTDHFDNYKIANHEPHVDSYIYRRKVQHIYDPRITLSVYLEFLNDQYRSKVDSNDKILPFSWDDWVDLSYLNRFLGNGTSSCYDFFNDYNIIFDHVMDPELSSSVYSNITYCLDNVDYMKTSNGKFRSSHLLPGFNFRQRIDEKSTFIGKIFNAKSYLLSHAPTPSFIYFLNENGTYYRVKPYQSSSMMDNGIFDSFINKKSFNGFDPIHGLSNLNPNYLIKNKNDFANQLLKTDNFKLDIPESSFTFNPDILFKDLYAKDPSLLEEHEKNFIDSIDFSQSLHPNDLTKHFKEVNIKWPAKYNGHKLIENGGHYDARFFSGFLSEMPNSEFTVHSPTFEHQENGIHTDDNEIQRRNIILSHLLHTLLTTTFHDGLMMFPAHGSLLSWYFTSLSFPWDSDGDVQMPIADLAEFCLRYNNSLIVENPKYGLSKLYVDCTNTLTHRGMGNGENNIDARVIDVDSGVFVDITGLAVTSDALTAPNLNKLNGWIPKSIMMDYPVLKPKPKSRKKTKINKDKDEPTEIKVVVNKEMDEKVWGIHEKNKIYNCRNDHFYTLDQLSPVRLTLFEGAPTFVVANKRSLTTVLNTEYDRGTTKPAWEQWVFSKSLRIWLNANDVYHACLTADIEMTIPGKNKKVNSIAKRNVKGAFVYPFFNQHEPKIVSELVKNSIYDITLEESLSSPTNRRPMVNMLQELFHDREYNSVHSKEMNIHHSEWEWKTQKIDDGLDIPNDWSGLAKWMLIDHPPPKISMLDYLTFVENNEAGNEIRIFNGTYL